MHICSRHVENNVPSMWCLHDLAKFLLVSLGAAPSPVITVQLIVEAFKSGHKCLSLWSRSFRKSR